MRIVGAKGLAEIDGVGELARGDVDDVDGAAIAAGFADAGVSIDRHVSEFAGFVDGDFVAVDADGNFGDFFVAVDFLAVDFLAAVFLAAFLA